MSDIRTEVVCLNCKICNKLYLKYGLSAESRREGGESVCCMKNDTGGQGLSGWSHAGSSWHEFITVNVPDLIRD